MNSDASLRQNADTNHVAMAGKDSSSFLPFALPDISSEEGAAVSETLESGWITTGPRTKQFEELFAKHVGASYALAVNSCTAALHLALDAAGISRGSQVITTPYTFAATAEIVRYFDAKPVFVDVLPDSLNIDPQQIETRISQSTKALVPVHIAGLPAPMKEILDIGNQYGIPVIEDAAHAFPSLYHGQKIGSIGKCTCFSFYATKTLTTGEGGMLCTDDEEFANRCRQMSLHGISRDAWNRYSAEGSWYYEIAAPGYKYNMTDIAAAIGIVQLRKAERMWTRRKEIAKAFNNAFSTVLQLQIPHDDPDMQHAWHLYMLRLNLDMLSIDRKAFAAELKERGIGISVHFIPLHIHPYYRDLYGYKPEDFPVAYHEYLREISLPIYSRMTDEDVNRVIEAVLDVVHKFKR